MKTQTVYLHTHYYSQRPKVGAARVSTVRWMDGQTKVGLFIQRNIIQLKEEGNSDAGYNTDEPRGCYAH